VAGHISYTSDVWSRTDLSAFMAITAHYLVSEEKYLILRNRLVAFRHVEGSHTGENLATIFHHVLQELAVLDCVSQHIYPISRINHMTDWNDYS